MNPTYAQAMALLNTVQPHLLDAIRDQLAGQPRAQAYDTDKTSGGSGSDPTATAALTNDRARHDLERYSAAVTRIYTAAMCLASLSEQYQPAHEPRRRDLQAQTRGCVLHQRAGIEAHVPAAHRTDFASVLAEPLKDPIDVSQAVYDFVRTHQKMPTNEELVRHHRTGRWSGRVTGAFSVESIAATRPEGEAA